jgi:hypothetical protein
VAVQKVKFVITQEDLDQAGKDLGEFVVPKNGTYVLSLKEISSGFSKDGEGKEDRKRPRLECIYEITGVGKENQPVEENYGNIWDYVSFSPEAGWRRAQFLTAFNITQEPGEFNINIQELVDTKVLARLRQQKGRNPGDDPRARINALFPFTDQDAEDAFGSEEEGEDEASEYLTPEELGAMDMKTLGATAREFDIEPNEYAKKVRGKIQVDTSGLIAAILEAQAAPEGEEESEDEESPF